MSRRHCVAGQSEAFRDNGLAGAAKARQALKAVFWPIQKPRPKSPKSATPEEAAKHPGKPVEVFVTDVHRLGLKPVARRVRAAIGERLAYGHRRFDWLKSTTLKKLQSFWIRSCVKTKT